MTPYFSKLPHAPLRNLSWILFLSNLHRAKFFSKSFCFLCQVGEKMYKMVGNLPQKDMAMLQERIKRVSRTQGPLAPLAAAQPLPAPTQEAASSHNSCQHSVHPSSSERQQPNSGIPRPKSSSTTANGSRKRKVKLKLLICLAPAKWSQTATAANPMYICHLSCRVRPTRLVTWCGPR